MKTKWWSDRFQEFNFGRTVLGSLQWILSIVILLKLFEVDWIWYIISGAFIMILTWIIGMIFELLGFRRYFYQAQFKDVELEGKQ